MKFSKRWLQEFLADPLPSDESLTETLSQYAFEVEDVVATADGDSVFDVKVLPNRAGDCLSHRGMAREISALLSIPLKDDNPIVTLDESPGVSVAIDDGAPCTRYMGVLVRGVKVGPSPERLVSLLSAVGQRSVNNVVDATNFIMLAYGQPMHAFDVACLSSPSIRIRMADDGEAFTTLSGEEKTLDRRIAVIADGGTGTALAMAGVKGGTVAALDDATTDILLESAHFEASAVRYASRSRQILTDSAKRFESDLDPELAREAMERCVALIREIAGGDVDGVADVYPSPVSPRTVSLRLSRFRSFSGVDLDETRLVELLARRHLPSTVSHDGSEATLEVSIPSWRRDIRTEEDLVEEAMQQYGYMNLVGKPQSMGTPAKRTDEENRVAAVRVALMEAGFHECMSYAFRAKGDVELENPIASDKAFLRNDLSSAMVEALRTNVPYMDLAGVPAVRLFEVGSVFPKEGETVRVCVGAADGTKKGKDVSASMVRAITALAVIGVTLDLPVGTDPVVEFDLRLVDPVRAAAYVEEHPIVVGGSSRYTQFSPFPPSSRDVALFAPAAGLEGEIAEVIAAAAGPLARVVRLFDRFEKSPTEVSYAFRIVFQADDRTLHDVDLSSAMEAVTSALAARGWVVR